jgi:hypothetical protein
MPKARSTARAPNRRSNVASEIQSPLMAESATKSWATANSPSATNATRRSQRSCARSSLEDRRYLTNREAIASAEATSDIATPAPHTTSMTPQRPRSSNGLATRTPWSFQAPLSGSGLVPNPIPAMMAPTTSAQPTRRHRADGGRPVGNRRKISGIATMDGPMNAGIASSTLGVGRESGDVTSAFTPYPSTKETTASAKPGIHRSHPMMLPVRP